MHIFGANTQIESAKVNENFSGLADGTEIQNEAITSAHLADGAVPIYTINIPIYAAKSNTNWSTMVASTSTLGGYRLQSSGAQNDQILWDIFIPSGTWTFTLIHTRSSSNGIYSLQFDSTEKGTIDGYNATLDEIELSTITGISVASAAVVEVKLKMTDKNGSSSSYAGYIQYAALARTGA